MGTGSFRKRYGERGRPYDHRRPATGQAKRHGGRHGRPDVAEQSFDGEPISSRLWHFRQFDSKKPSTRFTDDPPDVGQPTRKATRSARGCTTSADSTRWSASAAWLSAWSTSCGGA